MDHSPATAAIEDECAACHMPMTRYRARIAGRQASVFTHLVASEDRVSREALDGVSCALCHQISPDGLGAPSTWNGHFELAPARDGHGVEFGPFEIDPGLQRIMRSSTRILAPAQSEHVRRSELCASCHTLRTQALSPAGEILGSLPEQMPFQEWQHSDYSSRRSCQDCHMPRVEEAVPISRVLGAPRVGVARHVFVGANFFMQRMLAGNRVALSVPASEALLLAAVDRTRQFLATRAAALKVETRVDSRQLRAQVHVTNLGGHKLPTAYPSRRAWLHVSVRNASGEVFFESGALGPDGAIAGNDNDADARRYEPHYREIRRPDEVQIYESILGGADGAVTTGLLHATHYLKDNRILPAGFDKRSAGEDIRVVGPAESDPAFDAAGHSLEYVVDIAGVRGPYTVDVELLYQPIAYRWADNLAAYDAAEPRSFAELFRAQRDATAAVLAHATAASR
jgi:hypothetical protein